MTHSFFGGVYPATRKASTRRKPLTSLALAPDEVVLPLSMCADGPSVPLVRPGDRVLLGQPVAGRGTAGGTAIHASVSGRVTAVEDRPHPWGGTAPAIVIRNDGQDTPWEEGAQPLSMREVNLTLLTQRLEEAGVVGMGGGGPTWEKLDQAAGRVDTLIINAAECQPYVTADHRLLLERSKYILRGGELLARCLGANRTVLVTEGDKLNAVESVEHRLRVRGGPVRLCTVRTRYPLGAEKQIIQTVTGREVPPGGSPVDVKCVVLNVATVYAVQDAVLRGRPLTHRAVTVTGGAVVRPRNLWVPIGTPLRRLLEDCGGLREKAELLLTNGPMMGIVPGSLDAPVIKDTNCLVCLTGRERRPEQSGSVCIRCGKCVAACPMHLAPTVARQALEQHDLERLSRLHLEDCISCGCCSYICPAQIPLVDRVRQARLAVERGGFEP